ncbi:hypothetical protein ACFFLM_15335 [Deinococcus oregonensis]|uniref:Uncharacterized protein n=1 Tax=Deinococcus oregonensis TaxID=1805970 RepID=A0ABV6B0R3_9DEIO
MYLTTFGAVHLSGYRLPPRHLLFLTYLAVEGSASRARLRSLFWPNSTSAAASLRVLLSTMRRTTPGLITERGDRLILQCGSDLADLLGHLQAGRPTQALHLYSGPFLAEISPTVFGPELEEWLMDTRESITEQLWESLVHSAEHLAGQGRTEEATVQAEAAWHLPGLPPRDAHDLRRLHRLLLLGGSHQARRVAREARELGIDVEVSLSPAAEWDQPPLRGPHLPVEVTPFLGHRELLEELSLSLADPHVRLLTIFGVGGAGKSRLALQVAQRARHLYHDQVWWIPLEDVHQPGDLLAHTVLALGASLSPGRSALDVVITALRERPALLVFDQFEHLDGAAPIIADLLGHCPHLNVLVTSRHRLSLRAETTCELNGLDVHARSGQTHSDALALFVGQTRRVRPAYRFTDADLAHAQAVCAFMDGLPLAIELAANWMRMLTPGQILNELHASLNLLDLPLLDLPERHRNLRVVLEQSWQHLTPRNQEVLAALIVFQGGFTFEAATAVTGATLFDLQALVDKSMLRVDLTGRFSRHPLIAQLSRHHLDGFGMALVEPQHTAYFLQRSDLGFQNMMDGHRQTEWRVWFTVEYPNLIAALTSAIARNDFVSAAYLGRNLYREWNNRGLASTALSTALSLLPHLDAPEHSDARAWALLTAEAMALYSGVAPIGDALAAARHANNDDAVMCALYLREYVAQQRGDPAHKAMMAELYDVAVQTGRPAPLAITLRRRASVALSGGDGQAAKDDLEEGLMLVRRLGTTFVEADLHLLMGQVHVLQGELDSAEQCLRFSLQLFTTLSYRPEASTCLNTLAIVSLFKSRTGNRATALQEALDWCDQADKTFSAQGQFAVRDNVNARGFVLSELGRLPEAQACLENDVQAARSCGNRQGELMARLGLGHLALRRRDWALASVTFTAVVADAGAGGGHVPARWLALHGLANAHLHLGHRSAARACRTAAQQAGAGLGAVVPRFTAVTSQRNQRYSAHPS